MKCSRVELKHPNIIVFKMIYCDKVKTALINFDKRVHLNLMCFSAISLFTADIIQFGLYLIFYKSLL